MKNTTTAVTYKKVLPLLVQKHGAVKAFDSVEQDKNELQNEDKSTSRAGRDHAFVFAGKDGNLIHKKSYHSHIVIAIYDLNSLSYITGTSVQAQAVKDTGATYLGLKPVSKHSDLPEIIKSLEKRIEILEDIYIITQAYLSNKLHLDSRRYGTVSELDKYVRLEIQNLKSFAEELQQGKPEVTTPLILTGFKSK